MDKVLNFLKKYSFGVYKTGLYTNKAMVFGSVLSVILSAIFLLGLFVGIGIYFNEIFIQRQQYIAKQETKSFNEGQLSSYSLPKAFELFPNHQLFVGILGSKVNYTFCSTISLSFTCHSEVHRANFTSHPSNDFCFINLYQNRQIKEKCGDANQEDGFNKYGNFYRLNQTIRIYGLDSTMRVQYGILWKQLLSNGELLDQVQGLDSEIFEGNIEFSSNYIQYNTTTSIFEQLFSRLSTSYYQDAKSIDVILTKIESAGFLEIDQLIYPSFQSFQSQPKQFYEIFPLIGALLGLLKVFSFVSIYNQNKFEKELEASLSQQKVINEEEERDIMQLTLNDDLALNKSTELLILQKTQPEIQDEETKFKFKEVYSFATFKDMYQNFLLLLKKTKLKEAHLNKHDQLLRNLQNDAQRLGNDTQRLENETNQTNQKLNTFFEQLHMREEEISDLRTEKDQLQKEITTLKNQNSELRSKTANQDEQIQQIMQMMRQIKEELMIKQASSKKND